jgi:hypothetical protein
MEDEQPQQESPPTTIQAEPTTTVKNFWERLDEVFQLSVQNAQSQQKIQELIDQFPDQQKLSGPYRSFIFQADRVAITSNDDVIPSNSITNRSFSDGGHQDAETFSSFRVRLKRSLVNVKSIQLLSAVIPNAIQNIPDNSTIFFYYRLRSLEDAYQGEWNGATVYNPGDLIGWVTTGLSYACIQTNINVAPNAPNASEYWFPVTIPITAAQPNYWDLNPYRIKAVWLYATSGYPPEWDNKSTVYNRTFTDYNDLATTLNTAANNAASCSTPGDVAFSYDQNLNKIIMTPQNEFYYIPCGYEDPNIPLSSVILSAATVQGIPESFIYQQGYTLNLRLGYTWNGVFPDPFQNSNLYATNDFAETLFFYMRPADPVIFSNYNQNIFTFNSYGDLVSTSCVRIYADFILNSTEDSGTQEGLLSIVPINTSNLGVSFYQNNFNNPLTKVPRIITEIGIRLLNDQGLPYLLPNSATVLLELGLTYH